jgi:hypothetical protein
MSRLHDYGLICIPMMVEILLHNLCGAWFNFFLFKIHIIIQCYMFILIKLVCYGMCRETCIFFFAKSQQNLYWNINRTTWFPDYIQIPVKSKKNMVITAKLAIKHTLHSLITNSFFLEPANIRGIQSLLNDPTLKLNQSGLWQRSQSPRRLSSSVKSFVF